MMVRSIGATTVAVVNMLTPAALAAQLPFEGTSASADEIVAYLESRADTLPPDRPDFALERTGWHAFRFLTQFTGPQENPDHFGPRSLAELDAFADRLVAIAVAHPKSRAALAIGNALSEAAREGQPDQTAYVGAFDALERMFRADAAGTHHLIAADPRRGIAVAMDRLEAGTLPYPCSFLNSAAWYGEVMVSDGGLVFAFHDNADLSDGFLDRSGPFIPPDHAWRMEATGRQLHQAGYVEAPDPCRIGGAKIELAPGQRPAASEAEALAALRGADPDAHLGALAFMNDIGWRASDELKAVFFDAAWRHMRQLDVEPSHYSDEWPYITVAIRTHDPAGIPFLVEHVLGVTGEVVTNALADFGVAALPALLDYVRADDMRPSGEARALRVGSALRTLALIAEDGSIPPDMRPSAIEAARSRLTVAPQESFVATTAWEVQWHASRAMELAVALGDPDLRALVEHLTDLRSVQDLTGGVSSHEYLHTLASDLLAGTAPPGKLRKRCPLGDCPAGW
ncbi:MAG: hypothetical protein OXE96_00145 [Gemmatimonadetes bacterium]|nr:hypothetical protein [Gemmatimonadota bacterium]